MASEKNTKTISCSGDKDSKHPKVYINVPASGSVKCPYCSKKYEV